MPPYFTHCTAFIHYPAEVARELEQHFGDQLWHGTAIALTAEFGQLVHVGDTVILENSEGQPVASLRYIESISWVAIRNLTYLSDYNYTDYLITARQFNNETIYLHIEPKLPFGMDEFAF